MVVHRILALLVCLAAFAAAPPAARAEDPVEIHYAPNENLEHIDLALLDGARTSIEFSAFILTDRPVIDALRAAVARGVTVRILLDPTQRQDYGRLAEIQPVVRVKATTPIMHLKAYAVDGRLLRTGSANFSASGLKKQDNDLVLIRWPEAVQAFRTQFDTIYARGEPMRAD